MKIKKYEKYILSILIICLFFLLIQNFFKIIEGLSSAEKDMIYDQQADVNTIKTKQQNLLAEMETINTEMKTSNDLMDREKRKIEETLKKAEKKAEETGAKV
uniref:Uncharacterized protein n=1 Tax=viral metagenome TaxID=1070528 RepID=A0A6C0F8N0_9ZZZZ|tara:strand:- start:3506 stop:3811 length:306 start_codon:yes stop_codon:yes gene_type:complete